MIMGMLHPLLRCTNQYSSPFYWSLEIENLLDLHCLFSQEDNAKEITERIVEFVASLPKTIRKVTKESSEEEVLEGNAHSLHQHEQQHHQDQMHGYPSEQNLGMYGLGPGWIGWSLLMLSQEEHHCEMRQKEV